MRKTLPFILLMISLVLVACASPTSEPAPTTDPQEIENSVNATLTAVAPGEAPPPTEAPPPKEVPTATLLPSPTPTPTPELVEGDPAQILGEPDGVDTFDTKTNWTLFDNECFKSEITNGVYRMTAKGVEGVICWEVSWPQIENFYVDTTVYMPDECNANDRFGMLFRAPDNYRGYQYGLTCDGKYSLTSWDGEKTTVLVEPTQSDVINVGLDAVNRLGVAAHGSVYNLYVNGTYLTEVVDTTFTETGKLGYFVRASTSNGFVVEYDNLAVWQLDDQFIPPSAPPPPTTGEIPTPEPGVPTVAATTYVNVRSGPATFYPVLFVASPGATGEAVGISGDRAWYAVELPTTVIQSGIGWVSADFVIASGTENLPVVPAPPPPPGIEPSPPGENDPSVTTIDAVNIRSGPNNQCPSFGVPPIGSTAPAYGISADSAWYAVGIPTEFSPDGLGWVNANYVTTNNTENLPVMESQICP
ncbi:MAG: hypothetical protein MUO57_16830 [Anaerolineales bacterium]|nr:hypothetical protein [Anaerolineales bacterium]